MIDYVFSNQIEGIAHKFFKTSSLVVNDKKVGFMVFAGNRKDSFKGYDDEATIKLEEMKDLYMEIPKLNILQQNSVQFLEMENTEYILVITNIDYTKESFRGKTRAYQKFILFINPKNYTIYVPQNIQDPNKPFKDIKVLIELQPNKEVIKLIDSVLK